MNDTTTQTAGPLPLVDGPTPVADVTPASGHAPVGAVAARLLQGISGSGTGATLFLAGSERRADEIARALATMAGAEGPEILVFPPWDCLPYDRAPPSRESMGRRMAVLEALAGDPKTRRLILTSPEAVMQRVPPASAVGHRFEITVGQALDRDALTAFAARTGYLQDDRIDEPGEIGVLGEVVDVYPPAETCPSRIILGDGDRIEEIKTFDPVSQRTQAGRDRLVLTAASEVVLDLDADPTTVEVCPEHRLPDAYAAPLSDIFAYAGKARLILDDGVDARIERFSTQLAEAHDARTTFGELDGSRPIAPERLYLSSEDMRGRLQSADILQVAEVAGAPPFSRERAPAAAAARFILDTLAGGATVVLTGLAHERRVLARMLKRQGVGPAETVTDWRAIADLPAGTLAAFEADLEGGYVDPEAGVVVLTPTDILGGRLARASDRSTATFGDTELRVGDVVVHEDHGLAILQALEEIETDGLKRDVIRLEYHGGATLLAPVEEFGRIWRYSSEPSAVTLDRLNTDGWNKRRAEVSAQIDQVARRMTEMAEARAAAQTSPITAPKAAYARFAAGFPFPESVDQTAAIDAVLADLASGSPMNRLVCGDVGFGKTEVALRAAAAVALGGRQVLLAAPTTVLARQHYETFKRRFADTEVKVALLSRVIDTAEAKAVREGLADGSIHVVVGTHALAGEGLAFADLALVMIDEEHRFGAELKSALAARAPHLLALSATPIPRTLQSALVGIQDVSLIASPPSRRRPIRTFMTDMDSGSVRTVLLREKGRGGQSFVVAPRIEDLKPLQDQLTTLVPELDVVMAHGKLGAEAMDEVMTGFGEGRGDVLLATNIIENGLDVPRANTMLIWRPDRFGLAQLHQLRGRVGRGRRQGFAYLLTDPETPLADNTRARLQTLEALDRLGAGFEISARDLDLRGGGDLVGDEQAGHIRLIGSSLYQRVLTRALRAVRGETGADASRPKLNLPLGGALPSDYIPEATLRINLYARLAQLETPEDIDALHEEIEDRFGPLPDAVVELLAASRLSVLAAAAGVTEVVSGPKGTAFAFHPRRARRLISALPDSEGRRWSKERLVVEAADAAHDQQFLEDVLGELAAA